MSKKLKLIKGLADSPLKKLNEGQVLKNPDKYVFEGVFTQCSTPEHKVINRNGRIYMEQECLRHLGYLRDMIKENNGRILGELDHPEGRFEVSMKEASHMITDLWYDQNTHCVMGRLEVLDTPNGKTLKSLIEAGFPLYVSSRAAGDVNTKTKEVEIAQIFTYDVVCTPGFKEARLERVNESLLSDAALKYINESAGQNEKSTKMNAIDVPMDAVNESEVSKFNDTKLEDVTTPLNEDEEQKEENSLNDDVKKFLPIMNTSGSNNNALKEEDGDDENKDENSEESSDENKDENKDKNKDENSDENSEEVGDDEEKKELTDEEKEANREKIVSVEGFDEDGNKLGDSEENKKDDIENIEGEESDEKSEENKDDENKEESSEEEKDENSEEEANEDVENETAKAEEKSAKLKKDTDKDVAELESILASVKKKEEVKESIIERYPFAAALTEANFAKFAALRPNLKKRVLEFINDHEIYDIQSINELWMAPLTKEKKVQQNWLKLASQSDIDLYVAAPMEVQNAIEEQAQMFPMETEAEVDAFWNMTGLRQQAMRKAMNEKLVNDYNSFVAEVNESVESQLGYDPYLIRATELMLQSDEF